MDVLIGVLLPIGLPGYFILQALLPFRYDGGWRLAVLAPLLVTVPAMVHAGFALQAESNLWPIMVVLTAPFLFIYLCGIVAARYLSRGAFL